MTPKEYLSQAREMEKIINLLQKDIDRLKLMMGSVSSPSFEVRTRGSYPREAHFVKSIYRLDEMIREKDEEFELLLRLRKQINDVISQVVNTEYIMILTYRYLHNRSWGEISRILSINEKTARRWHTRALSEIKVPNDAIVLNKKFCTKV